MESPKGPKQFSWSSVLDAKLEYDEWFASLSEVCYKDKIGFCTNQTFAQYFVPIHPGAQVGTTAAAQESHRKEMREYEKNLLEYRNKYVAATGYLQSSLTYGTKARLEVDSILMTAPVTPIDVTGNPVPGWQWTPVEAFNAAMKHLKDTYAPSDAADCATIRQKIAELNDTDEGGFASYAQKFVKYHCALVGAQQQPDSATCISWVLQGIQNPTIRNVIAMKLASVRPNDPEPTFMEIFQYVEAFLKRLGDNDPYKSVKTSASGPIKVAANVGTKDETTCTRCWRKGHTWKNCKANACSACGKPFHNSKYCLSWQDHTTPGTRWAPHHLTKDKTSDGAGNKRKRVDPVDSELNKGNKDDKLEAMRAAKKAFIAAKKELKREKKEG